MYKYSYLHCCHHREMKRHLQPVTHLRKCSCIDSDCVLQLLNFIGGAWPPSVNAKFIMIISKEKACIIIDLLLLLLLLQLLLLLLLPCCHGHATECDWYHRTTIFLYHTPVNCTYSVTGRLYKVLFTDMYENCWVRSSSDQNAGEPPSHCVWNPLLFSSPRGRCAREYSRGNRSILDADQQTVASAPNSIHPWRMREPSDS